MPKKLLVIILMMTLITLGWAQKPQSPMETDSDCSPVLAPYRAPTPPAWSTDNIIWTVRANMPTARYSGATGTYGGEIFVAMGRYTDAAPYNTAVVEAFNPSTNTWRTNCLTGPTARRMVAFGAMYEGNQLFVVGGRDVNSLTVGTLEIYNMATNTWTTGPTCGPRWAHGGAVLDGYVYVFGGDGASTPNTSTQRYSIAGGTWETVANMINGDGWLCGAAAAGKVYAIGGSASSTAMREYNPATNAWTLKTPCPHVRLYSTAVGANNLVYVCGGDGSNALVDVYNPANDTWTAENNMPGNISWSQMGNDAGSIYVIGGTPQSSPVSYQSQTWQGTFGIAGQPAAVSNLIAHPATPPALACSLSWVNPTLDALGNPLTQLTGVIVRRDTVIIATLTPAGIGASMNYYDSAVPSAGNHTYNVYGYNSGGNGLPRMITVWIGLDVPGAVTNLIMTPGPNYQLNATLTWVNPTVGAHGGNFGTISGYHIVRSDAVTFELAGVNTTYYDGTVPMPDYYNYRVTPYNTSGNGVTEQSNTAYIGVPQVYTWEEIPYVWNDIMAIGTNTGLTGDDQNLGPFDLGFTFEFYETPFTNIRVCSNGWASFTSTVTTYSETQIPNVAEPNNVLYGFWDDLYLPTGGQIYYYADAANHTFTIQFNQVPHISTGGPYTFQIVLSQTGAITYYYNTMNDPTNSCTVGCENATGTEAVQICYDGNGQFIPHTNSAVRINPPVSGFGNVTGTITRDGLVGNITNVTVSDEFGRTTHPNASGVYMLDSVRAGNDRTISAELNAYFYPNAARHVIVLLNDTTENVNITLRRLEPTVPDTLMASIDPLNGHVTLTWNTHPDPTVDSMAIQRRDGTGPWNPLATVAASPTSYLDILPNEGQYFYRMAAIDYGVTPPPSQSGWTNPPTEVIWGELPPFNLSLLGTYDDRIRVRWHAPGASPNPPVELYYDDGTAEAWYVVQFPNGPHDYFAVRFTLPTEPELVPPIEFRYVSFPANSTDSLAAVMVCEDLAGVPDVNNPLISVAGVAAPAANDWAIATFEDFSLETTDDFWVVVQFTPGLSAPGLGSDAASPDLRSYWYYDTTPGVWHQWTAHDWMFHAFLGAEADGLISIGPSGVVTGETTPIISSVEKGTRVSMSVPQRTPELFSFAMPRLIWGNAGVHLNAPMTRISPTVGTDETDQVVLWYRVYRDAAFIDTSYGTEYFDMPLVENVVHSYYVTAWYSNSVESGPTNTDTARCNMAPGAPTNFIGNPNAPGTAMVLTWDDPVLNADGSACVDLAQLSLYRDGNLLGNLNPGVETYTDTPPNPTQFYTYTIRAKDEVPNIGPPAMFIGAVQGPWAVVPFVWNDISAIGTNSGLNSDDQNLGPFPIGFNFTFYDNTYNSIRICSNGFASFTSTSTIYTETAIPNAAEPNNALYAFWDDLTCTAAAVYYYYNATAGTFTIQYQNVPRLAGGGPNTFQIILTEEGDIYYYYHTLNPTVNSCTVGIENANGTEALQVCFDGTGIYLPTAQTGIWFRPPAFGALDGYVREAEDNDPIENASVACHNDTVYTNASGYYLFDHTVTGTYPVTAFKLGYNAETENATITEGDTTALDFFLTQPVMGTLPSSINVAIPVSIPYDETFDISNLGDGTLTYDIRLIGAGMDAMGVTRSVVSSGGNSSHRNVAGPVRRSMPTVDETDDPWVTADPRQGSVEPGESQLITLSFLMPDSGQVGDVYDCDMRINNNTVTPELHIPIEVTIIPDVVLESEQPIPLEYALYQNYPNPFNPVTRIRFDLRETSHVVVEVFDVLGRKVVTLVDNTMGAGRYTAEFDATKLASGLYFYRISANDFTDLKKMVLVK